MNSDNDEKSPQTLMPQVLGCDLVVSAIGVRPNVPAGDVEWRLADDGGLLVDDVMAAAGVDDVHAAGDACTAGWPPAPHWFQMRLWTQARTTGLYAGRCLAAALRRRPRPTLDFSFELFTHVTHFFGFKVAPLSSPSKHTGTTQFGFSTL